MADAKLFDERTRRKLEQLMLVATRVRAGAMKGERRSTKRGTSIEFADYRDYARGDDLRRLDWNIYARLERPFIKLLEDEEDLAVHLLIDTSASMAWPQDGDAQLNKFLFAQRLLAGLAYISLATNDRLILSTLGEGRPAQYGPVRGRGYSLAMLNYVNGLQAHGVTDLNVALKSYAQRGGRPGLCFVISDLMSPNGFQEGVNALLGKGYEVGLIQVLSPDEVTPPIVGDLRLVDVETGRAQEVSLDGGMRDLYLKRFNEWRDGIQADCVKRGVHFVTVETSEAWERVILQSLRRLGAVK
ncbi:MAG: DUF58 domain-containing protein [Chloroflexi bacterium]|nr:DUF58 domain-containing protein [Chloroflexota bacterium]MCC6893788.1 DUF58 domain-containing protein [Anaerolineae bacterium]